MQANAFASMGWTELYDRLSEMRAELAELTAQGTVDMERYRELRQQIAICRQEIERFHKRSSQDRDTPPNDGLRRV
jgi:uncharacterized small protein (DUF1192 family)